MKIRLTADVECLEERLCSVMPRRLTRAIERDLCAALEHILIHRSRTSHRCKCGYRTVWGVIECGECPECDEGNATDEGIMISHAQNLTDRGEWLERRRQGIGGSDAPVILGLSRWKSPLTLWSEKVGLVDSDKEQNEWMEWGQILEEPIAEKYCRETGRELRNYGPFFIFEHSEFPHMICTIDREIRPPDPENSPGVLEIKTAAFFKSGEWEEEPPLAYQVQLQHELAVTGLSWGSFAVLIGGQRFRWCDVSRNDRFIDYLIEQEQEFWNRVVNGDPPRVDASDSTAETLARLFPRDKGYSVELPAEALRWDEQLIFAKAEIDSAMKRKQEAENWLKAAIGEASIGLLPGGGAYSWKSSERKGYTVAPAVMRTLRRISK